MAANSGPAPKLRRQPERADDERDAEGAAEPEIGRGRKRAAQREVLAGPEENEDDERKADENREDPRSERAADAAGQFGVHARLQCDQAADADGGKNVRPFRHESTALPGNRAA